jgi:site-specific recombinase XerD
MEFFMYKSNGNLKVSFYLKRKISRKGFSPVMGRITIGKDDMVQFSCKLEADANLWDARAGRVNGKSHHAREVNREIDKINVAVHAKYREILSIRGNTTAGEVKNSFQGISTSQETLLQVFREHNEVYEKQAGVNCAIRTWKNYEYTRSRLEQFIQYKYHVSDYHFTQLTFSFIENYYYFLRIVCKLKPLTALKNITSLRKMVNIAIRKKIIGKDPFSGFSPERPKPSQRYVPDDELQKLMNTPLNNSSLEVTRDMFIFSCFTGLAYIDLFHLTNEQIVKDNDGALWIDINRQKTGSVSKIPLLKIPLQLIEKYRVTSNGNDRVFPMKCCSVINRQLKQIAELCDIQRNLTFHMARHTFATETCLSQDVSIETVSRMMGHKKLSTTQIYAKVTHNKINENMTILSEKIKDRYVLAS